MRSPLPATLFVDCRCTLGEGILWCEKRRALLWTDIQQSTLWLHRVADNATRTWTLPDRLGSLAICESGRLLLGLAKGLFLADIDTADDAALRVQPVVGVEAGLPRESTTAAPTARATSCSARSTKRRTAPAAAFTSIPRATACAGSILAAW